MEAFDALVKCIPVTEPWQISWKPIEDALNGFVRPMKNTPQDPLWHGEGDVWTHTKGVCEALVSTGEYRYLPENRKIPLFLAALFHDIGKIQCTRQEDGRWTSPNHSAVGASMARQFLWQELGLCGTEEKIRLREHVINLIRYHGVPPHAIDQPNGKLKLLRIAANGEQLPGFCIRDLCLLSMADVLGRVCADQREILERIELCLELAKEAGCDAGPFRFSSRYSRYAYLNGKNIQPDQPLYDYTWGEVIMMSGLPGTGKDTWIREHYPDLPMISLDEIRKEMRVLPMENQTRVVEEGRERAREFLRRKQPFVWNATDLSVMVRQRQVELFAGYHASVRIEYLETSWTEQLRRNKSRPDAVPEQAICHMMDKLVLPEAWEAHRVLWHSV